jgi:hypothetical protein
MSQHPPGAQIVATTESHQVVASPRVRPYQAPGHRVTMGLQGTVISSPSHPVLGPGMEGASDIQLWTPHGIFRAMSRVWQGRVGGMHSRSPGAYAQAPALWQIQGIPDGFLSSQYKPNAGRTATPPFRAGSLADGPQFTPPLPTNPLPGAWVGTF